MSDDSAYGGSGSGAGTRRREKAIRRVGRTLLALAVLLTVLLVVLGLAAAVIRVAQRQFPILAGLALLAALLAVLAAVALRFAGRLPRRVVLDLDLTVPVRDHEPADPLGSLVARGRPSLRDTVESLERAGRDRRVVGLFARVGGQAGGFADVQELRDAISAFRATGRFTVVHGDSFGEFTDANAAYYLASAFAEIVLQPSGDVGLTGVGMRVPFLRGALDRLGVTPQFDHRHEYKNAMNLLTEEAFTPEHREVSERIVESLYSQLVAGVAEGRGLSREAVAATVDRGPLLAAEAVDAGLVDRLAYRDEALDEVRRRAGPGARLLPLTAYRRRSRDRRHARAAATVALIHGSGAVVRGQGRFSPLTGRAMGAASVGAAFRDALADPKVQAILFRVDSPGGSYVASDTIWRETCRARQAGKPVIVSMGNVAASGGYFVAMAADRIVAHPGTLTGSIGVVAGKVVLGGLQARVGIATEQVHRGANAMFQSPSREYTPDQWSRLQSSLDRIYGDFTAKVAEGRRLPAERVHEIARGRVWTGADALELGLVDTLGGYPAALAAVRETLGLATDARVDLRPLPRRSSRLRRLLGAAREPGDWSGDWSGDGPAWGGSGLLSHLGGSLLDRAGRAGILDRDEVLTAVQLPTVRW